MVEERAQRHLAAIFAADVVGYSRLMERDETDTFERLRTHRNELFEPEIKKHNGRIFKLMGDGLLAEFASVVDAVQCAVTIQRSMADRNMSVVEARRIDVRIGVNLGDVIVEGDDLHGDGVNIAARLQAMSAPGGICISGTVFDQVRAKLALPYQYAGEQQVKNIAQPVRIYHVPLEGTAKIVRPWSKRQRLALGIAPTVLVVAAAGIFFADRWRNGDRPAPDRPAIAVLPFVNMSDDLQQDYFADGMTEDLITDLSKIAGLFVISRNSTFVYKGKAITPAEVADDLGVRYLLEGSVRRQGDQLRVNAQLIDTATSGHLWAERYDRTVTDVFSLQDDITRQIVAALELEMTETDREKLARKEITDVRAYDAYLQGWELYRRNTPRDHWAAISQFGEAIAVDPNYGRANAALALTYYDIADFSWSDQLGLSEEMVLSRSRQYLDKALQYPTSTAHLLQGEWLRVGGRFDEAIAEFELAVALEPSDLYALANLSNILTSAGRADDGLEAIERAMQIDPHYPALYLHYLAKAQFGLDRFTEAAEAWERETTRNPELTWGYVFLAAAYGHLGRIPEARAAIAKADAGFEGWARTTVLMASQTAYRERADLERLLDGLRKAGVPELPFDYDQKSDEQVKGDEIRALLFGHTTKAHDADGSVTTVKRLIDGATTRTRSIVSDGGQTVIEDDRVCTLFPISGRACFAVFHNTGNDTSPGHEYIFVSPGRETPFSVID